jgi:putative tryptophan/tyrosine transport system substrate-binding protein
MSHIRRREFISLLGGTALAWPLAARAQQGERVRRIGVMATLAEGDPVGDRYMIAFREGLEALGWSENRNLRLDIRRATPDAGSIERAAQELVALQPDVILTPNTPTTAALQKQTRTIPILFVNVSDPIGSGFVASLSQPGGNITGFLTFEFSIGGKWLELLKEIAARVTKVAVIFNPNTAPFAELFVKPLKVAAASLGVDVLVVPVRDIAATESVLAAEAQEANRGLIVIPDAFLLARRAEVIALAARYRVPAIYPFRAFTDMGGLISFGHDNISIYRRAATYADSILRGAKPGELPLQFPVKFELVINRKTAGALGLDVPASFYWRADEVIE